MDSDGFNKKQRIFMIIYIYVIYYFITCGDGLLVGYFDGSFLLDGVDC